MALELVFRPKARKDLARIIAFVAGAADLPTAERYHQRVQQLCLNLLQAPGRGMPYARRPGVRKANFGPYKIYYRVTDTEIIILRLWDGRRGSEPQFPR